jgi:hypothetical protein
MQSKETTLRTFQRRLNISGVLGVVPFTSIVERTTEGGLDEEKTVNLMLVYSSETIFVYEVLNAQSREMNEVSLDLCCSSNLHATILSVNQFTNAEDGKTVFLVSLEESRIATLSFNYRQGTLDTVAIHKLMTRETEALMGASTSRPSKPILRVDLSKTSLLIKTEEVLLC